MAYSGRAASHRSVPDRQVVSAVPPSSEPAAAVTIEVARPDGTRVMVRLGPLLPKGAVHVAESGINTGADIRKLREAGYQAFLIGESLMKAESPEAALRQLIAEAKAPPLGTAGVASWGAGTKD